MNHQHSELTQIPMPSAPVLTDKAFYLIKLFTHDNEALFGTVVEGRLEPNPIGTIAIDEWKALAKVSRGIELDQWVLRPDRLEGIVAVQEPFAAKSYAPRISGKPRLLSSFIAGYKAAAAKRINLVRNCPGGAVWQRSYQERLIPDDAVLQRVRVMLIKQLLTSDSAVR
ncbi:MAG: hypothetical protein IGR92_08870 [Leptolyngbyaceae cyanobacterium T60_A2020_046]|nr:hypothetical protein [Leptolyngbyaceae cyanobacterium T60_A2020_046]